MGRTILHSDCNCFYASVEMLHHPETRNVPMAVGGDPEARHGIVLTANYIAKRMGVKTGMALWQARQVCPQIVFISPHYDQYIRFSRYAREIYSSFTDLQEPFDNTLQAVQQFVPRAIRIKGLWAMVSSRSYDATLHVLDTNRLPEYLYLYVRDTSKEPPTFGLFAEVLDHLPEYFSSINCFSS